MGFTKDMTALQREFFAGGQLPFAGVTGETSEMIDVITCSPHPVTRLNVSTAFGTFVSKMSKEEEDEGRDASLRMRDASRTDSNLVDREFVDL